MFQKNQEYEIEIDDIGTDGEGIGHISNFAVFVKGGLPGDLLLVRLTVVKKTYAHAKQLRILRMSPLRVTPACTSSENCGGCHLQHCSYTGQLSYKTKRVRDALIRIGGINKVDVLDTLGMQEPYHYRNKAQFQVCWESGEPIAGFYAMHSHKLVPIQSCNIQHPMVQPVMLVILKFIKKYKLSAYDETTGDGIVRHIIVRTGHQTSEIMVCIVINAEALPHSGELSDALKHLGTVKTLLVNINRQKSSPVLGSKTKCIYGSGFISDFIGSLRFQISACSFFQVNSVQARVLCDQILSMASFTGEEIVVDAFCGIGTIALYVAKHVGHVYGIEIEASAIDDATANAALNSIDNVTFLNGDSEQKLADLLIQHNIRADTVIVDPPRRGCSHAVLQNIIYMRPKKLIYVSCDPATLARDLKVLCASGLHVQLVQPIDMFPHTSHVECVVLMSRNDG